MLKTVHIFVETDIFYFAGFTDEQKVQKNSIYLKFCNIISVFTVTFD